MTSEERNALIESYLGRTVRILIDRPMGYVHKKEKYTLTYPVNYGYIPDVCGGDGEELDVYLLGVDEPVEEFTCRIIGAAYRKNDVEDKLVAAPIGRYFTADEIYEKISFQEQWYDTGVVSVCDKSYPHHVVGVKENAKYYERPGAYIVPEKGGKIGLIKTRTGYCFIGGGMEKGENDFECLRREVLEETGYSVKIGEMFATAEQYKPDQTDIGYFHPSQYYYTGRLIEKVAEPIEPDHELQWLTPDEARGKMSLEMHEWAISEKIFKLSENNT